MKERVKLIIADVPDRDNLVAEIWVGEEMLFEISNENDTYEIEIYPHKTPIKMSLNELEEIFKDAKNKTTGTLETAYPKPGYKL